MASRFQKETEKKSSFQTNYEKHFKCRGLEYTRLRQSFFKEEEGCIDPKQ